MPTLTFCCGAGCGVVATNSLIGGRRHWDTSGGSGVAPTVAQSPQWWSPGGPKVYQLQESGFGFYFERNWDTSPTGAVLGFAVGFTGGSFPSSTMDIMTCRVSGLSDVVFRYNTSDKTLRIHNGAAAEAVGPVVSLDTRYWIDISIDVSTNPHSVLWKVNGVTQSSVAVAEAASSLTVYRIGSQSSVTVNMLFGDIKISQTLGDYPIGDGKVQVYFANRDGTHVYNLGTDFKYNNTTNVPTPSSSLQDAYTYVRDTLDNINDFMACPGASNTEYLEFGLEPPANNELAPQGVEIVSGHHSSAGGGNKMTLRINDGGSLADVWTDIDISSTTLITLAKHFATKPSGGAWTLAAAQALLARFNSSYGTPSEGNVPFLDSLAMEVALPPSPPGAFTGETAAGEAPIVIQPDVSVVTVW